MLHICIIKLQQMILQEYYQQKKNKIETLLSEHQTLGGLNIDVRLCNDFVFTAQGKTEVNFPLIMFMYDDVQWNTSSEKEYKADVCFKVQIVYDATASRDFEEAFTIASIVDKAVLEHPTKKETELDNALITNAAFKHSEKQLNVEDSYWEKNHHFVWCITYKTTLIEKVLKKKYTMLSNNFFDGAIDASGNVSITDQAQVSEDLQKIGYDLNDYVDIQTALVRKLDQQDLLKVQEVNETVALNSKTKGEQSILNDEDIAANDLRQVKKQDQ